MDYTCYCNKVLPIVSPVGVDETPYVDLGFDNFPCECAPFILFYYLEFLLNLPLEGYNSPVIIYSGELPSQHSHRSITLFATQSPYFLDPRTLLLGEDHQSTFGVSGGDLSEIFDDSSEPRYLGNVACVRPRCMTIGNDDSGNLFPPLHSAGANDTSFPNTTQSDASTTLPSSPARMNVPSTNQYIGSKLVRKASERRRRRPAAFFCHLCGADYTSTQNLGCLYFSLIIYHRVTLTHADHLNKHLGLRSYACKYKDQGCAYSATAPRTATRHSASCKYIPSEGLREEKVK